MIGAMERIPSPSRLTLALERLVALRADRLGGQRIPSTEELMARIEQRRSAGEGEEAVVSAEVEDFERSAATVNARTQPLVPAAGLITTGAGVLSKIGDTSEALALTAMGLAVIGLGFLTASLFLHAGRRSVGLAPTREDVAFAQTRLIRKEANAQIGATITSVAILVLLAAVLSL
jgi:hypothetical protein